MLPEEGQILTGPQFGEPVRVETVKAYGPSGWVLGVVGTKTERFRRVTLTEADLAQIVTQSATFAFRRQPEFAAARPAGLRPRHRLRVRSVFRAVDPPGRHAAAPVGGGLRLSI
jgi:hypothetical protein